ncbi:hydroxymethylbilane synthase [Niabella aquatica]
MQNNPIRIGTRESQLAIWQADLVKSLLERNGCKAELVYIKSEGDLDLVTPLYAMGVQGVFTRSLDIALLNGTIDIAVHSMKDVPVQLPQGITQAAVLKRANYRDVLVHRVHITGKENKLSAINDQPASLTIATSSIRRRAQWLHRYPNTTIENLRGNINTRLKKVAASNWDGAIFAAAGLERINLRPESSTDLDWMLPAPAQGAIMVVGRTDDTRTLEAVLALNHSDTATCVKIERDFLSALMGGCSTPISALAEIVNGEILFKGNIVTPDGKNKVGVEKIFSWQDAATAGAVAAGEILQNGGNAIIEKLKNG